MNDTCHVQSSKKDFYLGALGSFDHDFTHKEKSKIVNGIFMSKKLYGIYVFNRL